MSSVGTFLLKVTSIAAEGLICLSVRDGGPLELPVLRLQRYFARPCRTAAGGSILDIELLIRL